MGGFEEMEEKRRSALNIPNPKTLKPSTPFGRFKWGSKCVITRYLFIFLMKIY